MLLIDWIEAEDRCTHDSDRNLREMIDVSKPQRRCHIFGVGNLVHLDDTREA